MNPHLKKSAALVLLAGAAALFCGTGALCAYGQDDPVRVYPPAPQEPLSTQFTVSAGGHDVPVYLATVLAMSVERRLKTDLLHFSDGDLGQSSFASFDLRGDAPVSITCPQPVTSAKILPTSCGIVPQVSGNTVTFTLSKPGQYVLEINGDWVQSLQVFANPWESDAPNPGDPHVLYYGPGIHKVTSVKVTSGQTVYLAGDAVVYGTMDGNTPGAIFDLKGDHITVRGRGIIDGSLCPHGARSMIYAEGQDLAIRDVILRDSGSWTMPLTGSDRVTVKNVKLIGYRGNSDGIDVNDSRDIDISDSYIRTGDDLIVIKSKIPEKGETHNVTAEHCVLWNELAHALSLGAEMRRDVDNVHFSDCDLIHDKGREWALRIYQCDSGRITHTLFENIRIEECQRLISVWIGTALWGRDPERGHVDGVIFRDIVSAAPARPNSLPVAMQGVDADHAVHGVQFDHVTIGGRPLTTGDVKQNAFVDGVSIAP